MSEQKAPYGPGARTLELLAIDVRTLPEQTTMFVGMLAAFVADPTDVTGLKVYNLREAAKSLEMNYKRIENILVRFEVQHERQQQWQNSSSRHYRNV